MLIDLINYIIQDIYPLLHALGGSDIEGLTNFQDSENIWILTHGGGWILFAAVQTYDDSMKAIAVLC
jgi:hypothetical protein